MTYPLIGNYGVNPADEESARPQVAGFILHEAPPVHSSWRATEPLHDYLVRTGVVAIQGVDTRALTRHIRSRGSMRAAIAPEAGDALLERIRAQPSMAGLDLADADPVLTGSVPDLPDWDKRTKLAFEREMLGLYVSDHPLQGLEHLLAAERDIGIGELITEDGPRDGMVTIAGMITSVTRKTTKRGDIWAVLTVEDLEASIEVLLFPKAYDQVATVLATDTVVKVKGRVKVDDETVSLNASELTLPDLTEGPSGPVVISLPAVRCTPAVLDQLREVLGAHPGMTEVQVRLLKPQGTLVARLPRHRVTPSQPLMADLKALLGPSCLAP